MEGEHSEWREGGKRGALCMGREEGGMFAKESEDPRKKKSATQEAFC